MRYVFFGSPKFADIILEKLISAGMKPDVVVCNPDRPVGRKQIITPPPVKARVMNYDSEIKILQPEKLDEGFYNSLFAIHDSFDFFVVAAYAKIIPENVLKIPRLGTIGVHPSLLPRHRGSTPIQTAILNGDKETGVTLYVLDEKVDHGSIIAQKQLNYELEAMDYEQAEEKLAELGGETLVETLPKFVSGEVWSEPQDELLATFTKKFKTEDGFIEYSELARSQSEGGEIAIRLDRKIRALSREPGVYTMENGKRMKILSAEINDKKLVLRQIQYEGKNVQNI